MSLTVIQRFYDLAKQEAEAPAFGIHDNGTYHELPWWFIKSKAKHFCLGLLDWGADAGDHFYLLPSSKPSWLYADLGAMTLGLPVCPLPPQTPVTKLQQLLETHPPAFVFWGDQTPESWWPEFGRRKNLKGWIWDQDISGRELPFRQGSFRQVFNAGIRNEAIHHLQYRKLRQSLEEKDVVNPYTIDAEGNISEIPLNHGEINRFTSELSRAFPLGKHRRLYSSAPLWWTQARVLSVYWPILYSMQSVLATESSNLWEGLVTKKPSVAFLPNKSWQTLVSFLENLAGKYLPIQRRQRLFSRIGDYFKRGALRRNLKRNLGRRIRHLITEKPAEERIQQLLARGGLSCRSLQDFLL